MQEIKKRRIVLATVLKPVNEPRMFEKLGQSLAKQDEVHLIGNSDLVNESPPSVSFHPLPFIRRLSLSRIIAPSRIFRKIWALKPDLLIICTHELLFVAFVTKILLRSRIVYDVQENYWRNILYGHAFPLYLRPILAAYVRCKEWLLAPCMDYFFLAEAGYTRELKFCGNKKIILENKVLQHELLPVIKKSSADGNIHLLFSGTLAETTGVFTAVAIATKLHATNNRIRLHLIGYCPHRQTLTILQKLIGEKPFISLEGGSHAVHHDEIVQAIRSSDFGLITYPPNPATANAMPTKLYEYLGYRLPILMTANDTWASYCEPYAAAIVIDPTTMESAATVQKMVHSTFFTTAPTDVYWDSEEKYLRAAVDRILKT